MSDQENTNARAACEKEMYSAPRLESVVIAETKAGMVVIEEQGGFASSS